MHSYLPAILMVLSLVACHGSNPETPSTNAVIVAYVHSEDGAESGKQVELLEVGQTRSTGSDGLAEFVVPAGNYVVRAYGLNTGGPPPLFVDIPAVAAAGDTTRVSFFDCTRRVGPGVFLSLSAIVTTGGRGSPITAVAMVGKQGDERVAYLDDCCIVPPYFHVRDALGREILQPQYCDCFPNTHELGPGGVVSEFHWEGTRNVAPLGDAPAGEYAVIVEFRFWWPDREPFEHEALGDTAIVTWEGDGPGQ
jgi:hypothetical protein